jgi:hypothetical protein
MASEKKTGFTTLYEGDAAGTVAFDGPAGVQGAIADYLGLVKQVREDYKDDPAISQGLREIEAKLNTLRFSKEPPDAVLKTLESLVQVPVGANKVLRLDAFRKTSAKGQVNDQEEYVERVRRLVRNTLNNVTLLLINWPDDGILQKFMEDLKSVDLNAGPAAIKTRMETVGKGPHLWHYNQKKKAFLVDWLKPFQTDLGEDVESMTEERFAEALRQVEKLREVKLREMTPLVIDRNKEPYAVHNRSMHPVLNGKFKDFWGTVEIRDEFILLLNKLITRFSFNLQDRYLIFKGDDGGFLYLVGFADEALENPVKLENGKLGLFPHLKVFLNRGGEYQEISPGNYTVNKQAYFRALKTAVVPFLVAIGPMLDHKLSDGLRKAFDVWG